MIASDKEDENRIKKHIESRAGMPFTTIEKGVSIAELVDVTDKNAIDLPPSATVLMDSLTALLSNEMFATTDDGGFKFAPNAADKVFHDIKLLNDNIDNLVIVSDYIQSDANFFDEYTQRYRNGLAFLERELCKIADKAIEVVAGREMIISEKSNEKNTEDISEQNYILVIGGAYQGKDAFIKEKFELKNEDIYICDDKNSILPNGYKCYEHLERYVYACLAQNKEPICNFVKGTILVMDDIFCGVVPMDNTVRAYRERAGRFLQEISSVSEVYRVFCGRGIRL